MAVFRRIVAVGCLAGLLTGLLITAVHVLWVVPLIVEAERYESRAANVVAPHSHSHSGAAPQSAAHAHEATNSPEASPLIRTLWTSVANVLLGIGGGLLFAAVFAMRDHPATWRTGLLWGGGAYIALTLAPALGLPPELPGMAAADIADRQTWWLFTVISTAAALLVAANTRSLALRLTAFAMLAMPHLVGAPHPASPEALAPQDLQDQFVVAALASSALYWLVLGLLTAHLARRFRLQRAPLGVAGEADAAPCA